MRDIIKSILKEELLLIEGPSLRLKQTGKLVDNPMTTLYHGTSNRFGIMTLSDLKVDRNEDMLKGYRSTGSGYGSCKGIYLTHRLGDPNMAMSKMEENATKYAKWKMNGDYLLNRKSSDLTDDKIVEKIRGYIYEVELSSDINLYDDYDQCVNQKELDDYISDDSKVKLSEFDGLQDQAETVIWNKDKIISIKLFKVMFYNPDIFKKDLVWNPTPNKIDRVDYRKKHIMVDPGTDIEGMILKINTKRESDGQKRLDKHMGSTGKWIYNDGTPKEVK